MKVAKLSECIEKSRAFVREYIQTSRPPQHSLGGAKFVVRTAKIITNKIVSL